MYCQLKQINWLPILWHAFIALACLLLFVRCVSGPPPNTTLNTILEREDEEQSNVEQFNQKIMAPGERLWHAPDYTITTGDLLNVTVFEAPELETENRVTDNGTIKLPLLDAITVKGLTEHRAEEKIANAYRADYLEDPHVSVKIKERQGGKITVAGAVQRPGVYDCFFQWRVLDALALAGGLSEQAGQTVQIRRSSLESKDENIFVIDLDPLVNGGRSGLNIEIQRGDSVYVPQAGVVYVDGAVQKPGNYLIKQAMTVQEAIVAAGGYHSTADQEAIKLVRYAENHKREVIQLRGNNVEEDSANSITVKDRDIIFVESNKLAKMIYGLRLNLGFFGFGYSPPAR